MIQQKTPRVLFLSISRPQGGSKQVTHMIRLCTAFPSKITFSRVISTFRDNQIKIRRKRLSDLHLDILSYKSSFWKWRNRVIKFLKIVWVTLRLEFIYKFSATLIDFMPFCFTHFSADDRILWPLKKSINRDRGIFKSFQSFIQRNSIQIIFIKRNI